MLDRFLNSITMYRLTLYTLIAYIVTAFILSFFGILNYSPGDIVIHTFTALVFCYAANFIFSKFFGAVTNTESVFITALILVLIFPVKLPLYTPILILASFAAMGSKYLLTIEKQHIFNPAAWAAFSVGILSDYSASWWIGTPWMLPIVLIGGFLIIRKTQRESLAFNFLFAYAIFIVIGAVIHGSFPSGIFLTLQTSLMRSAVIFFATIMLTEPLSSPSAEKLQKYFAYLVAFLYATPNLRLFGFTFTPEEALCIGNIYSYFVSPKYRLDLSLKVKQVLGGNVFSFLFTKKNNFSFVPGQYMEWTLPHDHIDDRGNRRYFSIASSPTENNLMIAVKFYEPPSSYKKAMVSMQENQKIIVSELSGDFVLPKDLSKPLVFIAGGIGIAPYRSMIQYIVDKNLHADIILFYVNRTKDEIAFQDIFQKGEDHGVKTIYALTDTAQVPSDWQGKIGHFTPALIQETVPDYKNRLFYVSGPQLMVKNIENLLLVMGLSKKNIKTDFFPGYTEQ